MPPPPLPSTTTNTDGVELPEYTMSSSSSLLGDFSQIFPPIKLIRRPAINNFLIFLERIHISGVIYVVVSAQQISRKYNRHSFKRTKCNRMICSFTVIKFIRLSINQFVKDVAAERERPWKQDKMSFNVDSFIYISRTSEQSRVQSWLYSVPVCVLSLLMRPKCDCVLCRRRAVARLVNAIYHRTHRGTKCDSMRNRIE